jgi:hypothetical protein
VSLLANCRISSTERKSSSAWAGDIFCCGAELAGAGFCCGWDALDRPELGGVPAGPCCAAVCAKQRLSASSSARRVCVKARLKLRWWVRCRDKSLGDEGWLRAGNPYNNIRHSEIEQAAGMPATPAGVPQLAAAPRRFSRSRCSYSGSETGIPCASPARRGNSPAWRRSRRRNAAFRPHASSCRDGALQ